LEEDPPGPAAPLLNAEDAPLPQLVERYEAELIRAALRENGGDLRTTIESLGIPRKTFYDKLKRYNIQRSDFSSEP
jgi:two-component system C4-dicarboxylate transport response regulator DctD